LSAQSRVSGQRSMDDPWSQSKTRDDTTIYDAQHRHEARRQHGPAPRPRQNLTDPSLRLAVRQQSRRKPACSKSLSPSLSHMRIYICIHVHGVTRTCLPLLDLECATYSFGPLGRSRSARRPAKRPRRPLPPSPRGEADCGAPQPAPARGGLPAFS
jgi:hypothetical protein